MAYLLGYVAVFRIELTGCNEFLYRIDGDGLIDSASCAGVLAALIADRAAHRRERIILLYKPKCLVISTLACHFDIALNCDMRRACGLARCRAGIVALDLIIFTVVVIPVLFAPIERFVRKRDGRVLYWTFMCAQLLTELCCTGGAYLHTFAAGNAVFRCDPGSVRRCRAVGVVEKLRAAQAEARADGAVADAEYLIGAVTVGYLVHISVFLAALKQGNDLLIACSLYILAGLPKILGIVADEDANIVL